MDIASLLPYATCHVTRPAHIQGEGKQPPAFDENSYMPTGMGGIDGSHVYLTTERDQA